MIPIKPQMPPLDRPTVHVIDDDDNVSWAIATLLEAAGMRTRTYTSARDFLDSLPYIEWTTSECILTDIRMPEKDGLELLRDLRQRGCLYPVIVMTAHGDIATAVRSMKAGASDFIEKPFDDNALISMIHNVSTNSARSNLDDPGVSPKLIRNESALQAIELVSTLSPREREVLELAMQGKSSKVIAIELGISPRTVEVYRMKLMDRLGVGSFAEAVRFGVLAKYAS